MHQSHCQLGQRIGDANAVAGKKSRIALVFAH
jgi:hypothetical protein